VKENIGIFTYAANQCADRDFLTGIIIPVRLSLSARGSYPWTCKEDFLRLEIES
jgi:hypothetical protein